MTVNPDIGRTVNNLKSSAATRFFILQSASAAMHVLAALSACAADEKGA